MHIYSILFELFALIKVFNHFDKHRAIVRNLAWLAPSK